MRYFVIAMWLVIELASASAAPYGEAQAQLKAGQYQQALGSLSAFLQANPTDSTLIEHAKYQKVLCLWALKTDLPGLHQAADDFLNDFPDSKYHVEVACYRAMAPALREENWVEARNALAEFLNVYGREESAWKDAAQAALAGQLVGCGDFEQAKQFVATALAARPDHPKRFELRYEAAMAEYRDHNYPAAAERFRQLATELSASTSTLAQNAKLYSGLAKYQEAVQAESAIGGAQVVDDLFGDAVALLSYAIATAPAIADEARYTRMLILRRQGERASYEAAANEIRAQIAYNEAMEFKKRSDWQGLKAALTGFLAAEGKAPSKWKDAAELDFAETLNKTSEYADAQQYVAQKLAERPDHPKKLGLLNEMALADYRREKWGAAIAGFDRLESTARDDDYYDAFAKFLGGVSRQNEANRIKTAAGENPQTGALLSAGNMKLRDSLKNGKLPIKFRVDVYYHIDEHARLKAEAQGYLKLPEKATTPLVRTSMMDWLGVEYSYERQFKTSQMWFDRVLEEYKKHPVEAAGLPATNAVSWSLWLRNNARDEGGIIKVLNTLVTMPDDEFRTMLLWGNRKYINELTVPQTAGARQD